VFRGDTPLNLDAKGRLAIPSRYRDRLTDTCGGSLVVTVNPPYNNAPRCLMVYPAGAWKTIEEKIQALPSFDANAQRLRHLLIGRAAECEMDSHGRILLPAVLREWAGLDKKVRMIGQIQKFELWDEDSWLEYSAGLDAPLDDFAEQSAVLNDLVI
jgi:MraZ protein